ncbi:phosphotransferase [Pseudocolwellia agarivorans]|uniref:phosphotransferase n=1 Tax=Pseudocolwellia agarivorans TaxID=1911682 RepID=UPI0009845913
MVKHIHNHHQLCSMIKVLPCFTALNRQSPFVINQIEAGQSSLCFKVKHNDQSYFVKYNDNISFFENEMKTSKAASHSGLSPKIIYADKHWLVNEFIEGQTLDRISSLNTDKISTAVNLMSQCHQLKVVVPPLNIISIISQTFQSSCFSDTQKDHIQTLLCKLPTEFSHNYVVCHGDINFSNIITSYGKAWLIDFECTCLAEKEFELAMFFAINLLNKDEQAYTLSRYESLNYRTVIDRNLLNTYLLYSYLLNGLWYIEKKEEKKLTQLSKIKFKKSAFEQFKLFDSIWASDFPLNEIMR